MIAADDPRVVAFTDAVQTGDLPEIDRLLARHPELATERYGDARMSRTALHVATDWPGHWPHVGATIARLVAAGAEARARFAGPHAETPLHWAASSDDVEAIDALLDAGADLEADGAVLTGGSALDDAVVFAQWQAARRLYERGAAVAFWHAAGLGLTDRVRHDLAVGSVPPSEITGACWHAARAGHVDTVAALVEGGADLHEVLWEDRTVLDAAVAAGHDDVASLLRSYGASSAG
ncbi:MAG: hypothetical protein U0Q03_08055 [Acidimicrobiales bacterium]